MSLLKEASLTTSRRQGKNLSSVKKKFFNYQNRPPCNLLFSVFYSFPLTSPLINPPLVPRFPQQWINALFYYLVAILRNVETRDQEPWASLVLGRAKVMDTSQDINGAGNYFYPKN
jgi:hypothetical protein